MSENSGGKMPKDPKGLENLDLDSAIGAVLPV